MVIGGVGYRIAAWARDERWIAWAEREDTGQPFGVETTAPSEAEAIAALVHWLEWQHEHATALLALQTAERTYHRAMADRAFAQTRDESTPAEVRKTSLAAVEQARVKLDEVRARRP